MTPVERIVRTHQEYCSRLQRMPVAQLREMINDAIREAHREGQEAMRARAARECDGRNTARTCAAAIRQLEVE